MTESLLGPLTLITAFFGMLFVLATLIAPVLIEADRIYTTSPVPTSVLDTFLEEYLDDWPPNPYTVTDEDAGSSWNPRGDPMVTFDPGGGEEHPLKCWLVRDDFFKTASADYLVFQQVYGWFGTKEAHTYVPLRLIEEAYDVMTNYSRITIDLKYTFELFFWIDDYDLPETLYENNYNITVGTGLNDTLDSLSPWSMVGKIMTGRLPGVNWVVSAVIAGPIYMMLFYMGFVIIRSVIPLLGG